MKARLWMTMVAILMAIGLVAGAVATRAESPAPDLVAAAGKYGKMPEWKLKNVDGKMLSSADLKGKVLVIDFWATWCPPCRQEIPGFIELQKQYGSKGLQMVGFSFDQTEAAHSQYYKQNGMNYPSMFAMNDEGQKVVQAFEKQIGAIEGIPTTVIVDRQGNIVEVHVGYAPKSEFEKMIKPLL